jgi:hypothetical protein
MLYTQYGRPRGLLPRAAYDVLCLLQGKGPTTLLLGKDTASPSYGGLQGGLLEEMTPQLACVQVGNVRRKGTAQGRKGYQARGLAGGGECSKVAVRGEM